MPDNHRNSSTKAPKGVTCDACSEGMKSCIIDPESGAYICEDCVAFHDRAINAAAQAIYDLEGWAGVHPPCDEIARVAVKAYCEFTDDLLPQKGAENGL